jgi:hypothetical protein
MPAPGASLSIDELVDRKSNAPEKGTLDATDLAFYETEYERLTAKLEHSHAECTLADLPSTRPALNDLLVRLRCGDNKS